MTTTAQRRLNTAFRARRVQRDLILRSWGAEIDRRHREYYQQLAGIAAVGSVDDIPKVERLVEVIPIREAAEMEIGLRKVWEWSWRSATMPVIRALPMGLWFLRTAPLSFQVVGESIGHNRYAALELYEQDLDLLDAENAWAPILNGDVDEDEARELVRQLEFPAPSAEKVEAIINGTNAPDGIPAMPRLKTVSAENLAEAKRRIVEHISNPEGADSTREVAKSLRPLIYRNPDGTAAGVNYKAQRIARTEGVRVAEAGQREMMEEDRDLFGGVEWESAHVPDSRPEHIEAEGIYKKTEGGWVRDDGEQLPPIPLGPNCLCWTTPVLDDDLTAGLPAENLGTYAQAKKRFEKERAEVERQAGGRPKRLRKPKPRELQTEKPPRVERRPKPGSRAERGLTAKDWAEYTQRIADEYGIDQGDLVAHAADLREVKRDEVRRIQQYQDAIHKHAKLSRADYRDLANRGLDHTAKPHQIDEKFGANTKRSESLKARLAQLDSRATELARQYPDELGDPDDPGNDATGRLYRALGEPKPKQPDDRDEDILKQAAVEVQQYRIEEQSREGKEPEDYDDGGWGDEQEIPF